MSGVPECRSYKEYFEFYLTQHSSPANRALHNAGSCIALLLIAAGACLRSVWIPLAGVVIGYALAWLGHFVVEHNTPATFGHPVWSMVSNFHMLWLSLTGGLEAKAGDPRARTERRR